MSIIRYQRNSEMSNISLPKSTKIIVILHLCVAFTVLCCLLFQPILKEYLIKKSEQFLYQSVLSNPLSSDVDISDIKIYYDQLDHPTSKSFFYFFKVCLLSFSKRSSFLLCWIFLSVLLSILILMRIEGASQATWTFPFLILCLGFFSIYSPPQKIHSNLFPSEDTLVSYQPKDFLGDSLTASWRNYLISQWAKEKPSTDVQEYENQLKKGEFFFNLARLRSLQKGIDPEGLIIPYTLPLSLIELTIYLSWNLFFAFFTNRQKTLRLKSTLDCT